MNEKVASSIVDALKSSPILLLVLLLNIGMFVMIHFTAADTRTRQGELIDHLLENQNKLQTLLSSCIATPRSDVPLPPVRPAG